MGYRGDDATHGAWGRQTPWRSSPDDYPAAGDGGAGYGPGGGYPGQGQADYGPQGHGGQYGDQPGHAGPYSDPYGQQEYGQRYDDYDDYQQAPHGGRAGYGGPAGYPRQDDYGYAPGPNGGDPYGNPGYDSGPGPGAGYGPEGGYGYQESRPGGYGGQGTSGYPDQSGYGQSGAYGDQRDAYRDQGAGHSRGADGYRDEANGYPGEANGYGQPGGYQAPYAGSAGYPALPSGPANYPADNYPAEDAGNDWYGGQPAAANGASFADTGSYRLNGSVLDEYGTGPRGALRDPARGYPPGSEQPGSGQLPTSVIPAVSGPQAFQGGLPQALRPTGQQERYEENSPYPPYGQGPEPGARGGRGSGNFQAPGGRAPYDDRDDRDGFNEPTASYSGADRDAYNDYDADRDFDADGDPYLDQYGSGPGGAPRREPGRDGGGKTPGRGIALGALGGRRLLFAAIAVVVVGIVGVAAYAFLFSSSSPSSTASPKGALPTTGTGQSQQACIKNLGTYCYIEMRTDDPTPLTTAELYQPAFTNETDKNSYSLVSTKADTTCANAVIGQNLISAIKAGQCTQVLRASYVSGDNKIMGTIGVVNLATTNESHTAGKVVGQTNFVAPLTAAKGVASKLGNGTGVVEAEFKGHYLILTWAEFVNGTDPTTTAEDNQLEQFSNDLVSGTANPYLSQRMVTGSGTAAAGSGAGA